MIRPSLEDAPILEKLSELGGPNGVAASTDNRGGKGKSFAEGDKGAVQPGRTAESPKARLEEPKIPAKFLEKFGNLDILDDGEMRATKIEEPFSEIESKTIQMVNRYLARMQKQVEKFYKKPKKEMNRLQGIIRFELDPAGYLQDAYIFIGSGDAELDMAALDAVRSVVRYEVPENRILAERYYSVLNFYYSSEENKVDQAPWEDKKKEGSPQ